MPTNVQNAKKVFNFRIEVAGLGNQFEAQKVMVPELSIEQVKHGDSNHDVKTAGRIDIGNIKIEKIKALPGYDYMAWDWLNQAQSIVDGGGGLAFEYKRTLIIRELSPSGFSVINSWVCDGCWVCKVGQSEFSRTDSANIIQTLEISVDEVFFL